MALLPPPRLMGLVLEFTTDRQEGYSTCSKLSRGGETIICRVFNFHQILRPLLGNFLKISVLPGIHP